MRQAIQHGCLPSLLGDGDKEIEIGTVWKKYFVLGQLGLQPRQNKNVLYWYDKPKNLTKEGPFHLYSLSPHSPQFQQAAGATPL
jgi:hypothetical protein